MRTFVFQAAGHRYAMDAAWVQAVHPLVRAKPVPGAPAWLAGVIDVHGEFVPLVDSAALLNGTGNVQRTLGARILLIDTGVGEGVRARFGLAVDRIDDAVDIDQSGSWHSGSQTVAWLGEVLQFDGEPAQRVDARLLAAAFPQLAAPATSLAEREDA